MKRFIRRNWLTRLWRPRSPTIDRPTAGGRASGAGGGIRSKAKGQCERDAVAPAVGQEGLNSAFLTVCSKRRPSAGRGVPATMGGATYFTESTPHANAPFVCRHPQQTCPEITFSQVALHPVTQSHKTNHRRPQLPPPPQLFRRF